MLATCPCPEPTSSWLRIFHAPTSHFLKIHLNIILPSTSGFPKWPLSLRFPHQNPVYASPPPYELHAPPISFISILSPEQYWVKSAVHSAPHYVVFCIPLLTRLSPLGPNILLNTLFSNTLSLRSYLNGSDQVSHPYKTTGKIIVLYV